MRTAMWSSRGFAVRRRYGFRSCGMRAARPSLVVVGAVIGLFVGICVSRFTNEIVGFAVTGALFGLAFEWIKGSNVVRTGQPINSSQANNASKAANPSKPSTAGSVSSKKMKTHEREHHMTMVLLTSGIGGMVLGVGVYTFTHFAPAIFCGVVLSVLFTLWVTRERN